MSVGREKSWRQWKYLTMFGCDVWMFPSMHKNHVAVFCNVALKWRDAGKQSFFSVPELCIDCILLKIVVHTPCSGRPGSHNKVQCAMDFLFASLREKKMPKLRMVSSRRNLGFQATSRCPQVSNKMSSIQKAPNAPTKSKGRLGIFAAKPGGTEFSWLGGRDLCASFGCTVFLSWSVEMHEICDLGSTRLQEHAILWHAWLFPLALNVLGMRLFDPEQQNQTPHLQTHMQTDLSM